MSIMGFILSNPVVLAVMGGVLGALVAFLKGNSRGAHLERLRQVETELATRDIADQVDNDTRALPPNKAREELKRW